MESPSGIKYPFKFGAEGSVQWAEGVDKVKSNMIAIVLTALRERLIRKGVGVVSYQAVLRNSDSVTLMAIRDLLREALARHERRALVLRISVVSEDNAQTGSSVYVDCDFIFRQTGARSSFRSQLA